MLVGCRQPHLGLCGRLIIAEFPRSHQFPMAREATLMLSGGGCTVYFLGDIVPQTDEGWLSYDYAIDAQSAADDEADSESLPRLERRSSRVGGGSGGASPGCCWPRCGCRVASA